MQRKKHESRSPAVTGSRTSTTFKRLRFSMNAHIRHRTSNIRDPDVLCMLLSVSAFTFWSDRQALPRSIRYNLYCIRRCVVLQIITEPQNPTATEGDKLMQIADDNLRIKEVKKNLGPRQGFGFVQSIPIEATSRQWTLRNPVKVEVASNPLPSASLRLHARFQKALLNCSLFALHSSLFAVRCLLSLVSCLPRFFDPLITVLSGCSPSLIFFPTKKSDIKSQNNDIMIYSNSSQVQVPSLAHVRSDSDQKSEISIGPTKYLVH